LITKSDGDFVRIPFAGVSTVAYTGKIMGELEHIRSTLDEVQRRLPSFPRTVGLHFDVGTDDAGDPAVYIVVLLDESTRDEDWTSDKLDPIADLIRGALRGAGVSRWPYVRYSKPSELRAAG
jgi:hypothetical protein